MQYFLRAAVGVRCCYAHILLVWSYSANGISCRSRSLASSSLFELCHICGRERGAVEFDSGYVRHVFAVIVFDKDGEKVDVGEVLHFELADAIFGDVSFRQDDGLALGEVFAVAEVDRWFVDEEFDGVRRVVVVRSDDVDAVQPHRFSKLESHQQLLVVFRLEDESIVTDEQVAHRLARRLVQTVAFLLDDQVAQIHDVRRQVGRRIYRCCTTRRLGSRCHSTESPRKKVPFAEKGLSDCTGKIMSRHFGRRRKRRRPLPLRNQNTTPLLCLASTAECAQSGCAACAHKLFPKEALTFPNVRPEKCARFGRAKCTRLFAGSRVLTVGDGDLSFSVALKRSGCRVDASTLAEDARDLERRYPTSAIRQNVAEIGSVLFGMDATRLLLKNRYDRIIFNFPCLDVEAGADCQNPKTGRIDPKALQANQKLVVDFVTSAKTALKKYGEIIITHKTKPPYCWWNLTEIVPMRFRGSLVFDRVAFPPYVNRKARTKESFNASDARMYVFSSYSSRPGVAKMRGTLYKKRHLLRRISPSLLRAVQRASRNDNSPTTA